MGMDVIGALDLPTFMIGGLVGSTTTDGDYPLVILNRNVDKVIRIWRLNIYIADNATVTGVLARFTIGRATAGGALTGGTAAGVLANDTQDSLPASIDAVFKPTGPALTESPFKACSISEDESVVSTIDMDAYAAQLFPRDQFAILNFLLPGPVKPITLRTDGVTHQGFYVKHVGGGTLGGNNLFYEVLVTVTDQ